VEQINVVYFRVSRLAQVMPLFRSFREGTQPSALSFATFCRKSLVVPHLKHFELTLVVPTLQFMFKNTDQTKWGTVLVDIFTIDNNGFGHCYKLGSRGFGPDEVIKFYICST
jgi:hypothetical protein